MAKSKQVITLKWLKEQGACASQVVRFEATFGESADLTEANAAKAIEANLDLDWLAQHILTAPARAEYHRATAPAWAEYQRAEATARAEYDRATAPALAEYDRATATARAECERITATARAEYERAKATALLALLTDPANHK